MPNNDYTVCIKRETQTYFYFITSSRCFFNIYPVFCVATNYVYLTLLLRAISFSNNSCVFRNASPALLANRRKTSQTTKQSKFGSMVRSVVVAWRIDIAVPWPGSARPNTLGPMGITFGFLECKHNLKKIPLGFACTLWLAIL